MLRSTGEAEIQRLPLADETRPQNALGQIRISFRIARRQLHLILRSQYKVPTCTRCMLYFGDV